MYCFWIWLLFGSATSCFGQLALEPNMPITAPLEETTLMRVASPDESIESILSGKLDNGFYPVPANTTSVGISKSAWWIRFEATNMTDVPVHWILNYPFAMMDSVDIYVTEEGEVTEEFRLGDKRPFESRPVPGEGYAVPITTLPGQTVVIYTRIQNLLGDAVDTYFEVSSPKHFYQKQLSVWGFYGIIFGGIIILLLYNSVLYIIVRDQNYLWYLLYLFSAFVTFIAASGFGDQFLWSHTNILSEFLPPLMSSFTFFFVLQFSRTFLDTKKNTPRFDWVLRGLMAYYLLPPFVFLFGFSSMAAQMIMAGCLILSILPILSAYIWIQGHRSALLFTLAWGFWFVSIGMMAGRILGIISSNELSLRVGWIGILVEAVLFAVALAYRIRNLQQEKRAAENRERAALLRSKEELEALVLERTKELAVRHEELRVMNNEKDRFFSIIAHDLRNPFHGVLGFTEVLHMGIHEMSKEEVDSCIVGLRSSTVNLYKLLENLLSWSQLQRGGMRCQPVEMPLVPLLDQCIGIYEQAALQKKVSIRKIGDESLSVYADRDMLATVIRNLLNNAIKYSNPDSEVRLSFAETHKGIEITVQDNGIGMGKDKLGALFEIGEKTSTAGTEEEPGTGLGLLLCKELVDAHGGVITVSSTPGKGTVFRITLPNLEHSTLK